MGTASRRRNTHGSESEIKRLRYRWHRWYGRDVVTQKSTGVYAKSTFACRLAGEKDSVLLRIPRWMFDAATCEPMRIDPTPKVDYTALRALQVFMCDLGPHVALPVVKPRSSQPDHGDGDGNKLKKKPDRATDVVSREDHTTASVGRSRPGELRRDRATSGEDPVRLVRSQKKQTKRRESR